MTFLLALALAAQEPEGFGERWILYDRGWTWKAGEAPGGSPWFGRIRLRPGEWFLAERRGGDVFRWKGAARLYAVERGGVWIGRAPEAPGAPPPGCPLLAVELPGSGEQDGWTLARLDPLAEAEWIALRGEQDGAVELQGLEAVSSPETWERLERRVRAAADPAVPWPEELEGDLASRLPGHDVGRFARRWRAAFPDAPERDDVGARSLRIAWMLLEDPGVRPPAFSHIRRSAWSLEGDSTSDAHGAAWTRTTAAVEREVEGPATVRIRVRGAWDLRSGASSASRPAGVRVSIDGLAYDFRRTRGPDLELSRGLDRVLTGAAETRVTVPPGLHRVSVVPEGEGWMSIEEWRRIHQAELSRPEEFLKATLERPELEAVRDLLEGRPVEALARFACTDGAWAAVRGLDTALRLGWPEAAAHFDAKIPWEDLRGPLATEGRLAGLRFAIERGRPAAAGRHADAILRDPEASPEDCAEALVALDAIGLTAGPGRAWAVSDGPLLPRVLRRHLLDFDVETARSRATRWQSLVPSGSGGVRRWAERLRYRAAEGSPDGLWEDWARFRAAGEGGTWRMARPAEARFDVDVRGTLEILPLERRPVAASLAILAGERSLGRARLNDAAEPFRLAWEAGTPGAAGRVEGGDPDRVLLWRSRGLVWKGEGTWLSLLHANAPAAPAPAEFRTVGGAMRGFGRLLVEAPESGGDVDVAFDVRAGAVLLRAARLLRIGPGDPPLLAARLLLPAASVALRVEAGEGVVVGFDERLNRATPGPLAPADFEALDARRFPPGVYASGAPVPADPREIERAGREAVGRARARSLFRRAELLAASDLIEEAERDLEEVERLLEAEDPGQEELRRARARLASLAFERARWADLRARLRRILAAGGGSGETYLLAALSALAGGDPDAAAAWAAAARRHADPGPADLDVLVGAALGEPGARPAADPFTAVIVDLLRLRRRSRSAERGDFLRALEEWRTALDARSAVEPRAERAERLRRWSGEAGILAELAKEPGAWPPPSGLLDPLGVFRDVPLDPAGSGAREALMLGPGGFRPAWWMSEGVEVRLPVAAPGVYELEWRPGHAPGASIAAPSRLWIRGLADGPPVRAVCASGLAAELQVPTLPGVVPGTGDRRRFVLRPGDDPELRLRVLAGAGFATLRAPVVHAENAWGGLGFREGEPVAPRALPATAAHARPEDDLRLDLDRRLRGLATADPAAREALADDLIFLALERPEQADEMEILRALVIYEGLPAAPHRDAHRALAASLTRWRYADLSATFPELRAAYAGGDTTRSEEGAQRAALFHPLWDGSVLFDSLAPIEWRHRAPVAEFVHVDVVADAPTPGADPAPSIRLEVDGNAAADLVLSPGLPRSIPLSLSGDTLLVVRARGSSPGSVVRARLRIRDEAGRVFRPSSARMNLHRARDRAAELTVLGPTLVRMEAWTESQLGRVEADDWEALSPPAADLRRLEAEGTSTPSFAPPAGALFRIGTRVPDVEAWQRRLASTPKPVAPGAPPQDPGPAAAEERGRVPLQPGDVEVEGAPGLYEAFAAGEYRGRSSQRELDEEPERDELWLGLRYHVGGPELFARLSVAEIAPEDQPAVSWGELRLHHYFWDRPELDWRFIAEGWTQTINGESEASWETRMRLRWRLVPVAEQVDLFLSNEVSWWDGTLEDEGVAPILEDVYRRLWNDYRDEHRRWDLWEARLRVFPYQNIVVEPWGSLRTNEDFLDPDRAAGGVEVKGHYEEWFAELGFRYIFRFADDDRPSDDDETGLGLRVGWQGWLGAGSWLSFDLAAAWIGPGDALELGLGVVFRFGGARGERLTEVDPEIQRFAAWHDAVYPWRRP